MSSGRAKRRAGASGLVVLVALLVAGYLLFSTGSSLLWLDFVNLSLIASIAAIGLNLLVGHIGIVSVGNAAFYGIGGLVVAELQLYTDLPLIVALLAGAAASGIVGALIAVPSLRLRGLYVAIGTLGLHFVTVLIVERIQTGQVGSGGYVLETSSLFGFQLDEPIAWYPVLGAALVLVVAFTRLLLMRKPGRSWNMIREHEPSAEMAGIVVWREKVWAFAVSSAVVGLAGGLLTAYVQSLNSDSLTLLLAIQQLGMVIIGGLGSVYGPIAGAFVITCLPAVLQETEEWLPLAEIFDNSAAPFLVQGTLAGLAIVVVILAEPKGLAALGTRLTEGVTRRRRTQEAT